MNKRLLLLFYLRQRRKRKQKYRKKYWIRDIFRSRFLLGEYHTLVKEMRENDHESFYKYFRMTPERFDHLLLLVGPMLTKKSLSSTWRSRGKRCHVTRSKDYNWLNSYINASGCEKVETCATFT